MFLVVGLLNLKSQNPMEDVQFIQGFFETKDELDRQRALKTGEPKEAPPANPPKREQNPLYTLGTSNYGKFDDLARELSADDLEEKPIPEPRPPQMPHACSSDHAGEREVFQRSDADKWKCVQRLKEEGNLSFQSKSFKEASIFYRKALIQLDYFFPSPEKEEAYELVYARLLLNLGRCMLNQKHWGDAHQEFSRGLSKIEGLPYQSADWQLLKGKLHTFQAETLLGLQEFQAARKSLEAAQALWPGDAKIQALQVRWQADFANYQQRARQVHGAMFGAPT